MFTLSCKGSALTQEQARFVLNKCEKQRYYQQNKGLSAKMYPEGYIPSLAFQLLETFSTEGLCKLKEQGYSGNFLEADYSISLNLVELQTFASLK